jgi:hypothetical protein
VAAGAGVDGGGGLAFALRRGVAAFFTACAGAALRSRAWRFARAFFFTCALRRLMFIEWRRSCLPTGRGACPWRTERVKPANDLSLGGFAALVDRSVTVAVEPRPVYYPVPSAAAVSRPRTSRR